MQNMQEQQEQNETIRLADLTERPKTTTLETEGNEYEQGGEMVFEMNTQAVQELIQGLMTRMMNMEMRHEVECRKFRQIIIDLRRRLKKSEEAKNITIVHDDEFESFRTKLNDWKILTADETGIDKLED